MIEQMIVFVLGPILSLLVAGGVILALVTLVVNRIITAMNEKIDISVYGHSKKFGPRE